MAVAAIGVTELSSIIDVVSLLGKLAQTCTTIYKLTQTGDHTREYSKIESEVAEGEFRKTFEIDGEHKDWAEALLLLRHENITCLKRCCCSLTSWFPSGVITLVSWTVLGSACRHEYVILHTTNYVVLIEISVDKTKGKGGYTKIIAKKASTTQQKEIAEKELIKKNYWNREMAKLEDLTLGRLEFQHINDLITLWIHAARAGGKSYTAIQKNCKSLARTILYFSKKSVDYWDVVYSLLGFFTDKPLKVFYHVDMILIEKGAFNAIYKCSSGFEEQIKSLIGALEIIRCRIEGPTQV